MTDSPLHSPPGATTTEVELTEDQQIYEAVYGIQSEWHQPATEEQPLDLNDDDALYRALFGA